MKFYRIEQGDYGLYLNEYPVKKVTPKGVRLADGTFVLATKGRRRLAHPTIPEALVAMVARKRRYIEILKGRIKRAEAAIEDAHDPFTRIGHGRTLGSDALMGERQKPFEEIEE